MQKYRFILCTLMMTISTSAIACKFRPDPRSLNARLDDVPFAFIGRVINASDEAVVFQVDHPLRGDVKPGVLRIKMQYPRSSCSIRFSEKQTWLFAGDMLISPSMLLTSSTVNAYAMEPFRQHMDDLKLSSGSTSCKEDNQCRPLNYGCSITAVNNTNYEASAKIAYGKHGRPETLNCKPTFNISTLPKAMCINQQCSMWFLDETKKD